LGNMMQQWTGEAGLEGCSLHGLRHRFATELAAAGCTPHEISAWTGHRSLREVRRTHPVTAALRADGSSRRL
jgi:integrase